MGKAVTLSGMVLALSACSGRTPGEPLEYEDEVGIVPVEDFMKTGLVKTEAVSFLDMDLSIFVGQVIEEIDNPDSAVQPPQNKEDEDTIS